MQSPSRTVVVLATGGTIAGTAARAGDNISYTAGQVGVDELVATLDDLPDLADPHPPDWTLVVTTCSLFTHTPTGTRIALPLTGPWVFNPADPRIAACPTLHAVLHAP